MPSVRPTVSEVRASFARVVRDELKVVAGDDRQLSDTEKDRLTPVLARAAGGHVDPGAVVDAVMAEATASWRSFNQANGSGAAWLSKAELAAITAADPALGALTKGAAQIALTVKQTRPALSLVLEAPAGISMATRGVRVLDVSLSAGPSVPVGTSFALLVDGHRLTITKTAGGLDVWGLKAPEGYGLEVTERGQMSDPNATARLKITRDAETALPHALLKERAKSELLAHVKNERMLDDDWRNYFPHSWPENVARGVPEQIAAFFEHPETEVLRKKDTVTFVGRGPFDLYTEITLAKRTGKPTHVLVEID